MRTKKPYNERDDLEKLADNWGFVLKPRFVSKVFKSVSKVN